MCELPRSQKALIGIFLMIKPAFHSFVAVSLLLLLLFLFWFVCLFFFFWGGVGFFVCCFFLLFTEVKLQKWSYRIIDGKIIKEFDILPVIHTTPASQRLGQLPSPHLLWSHSANEASFPKHLTLDNHTFLIPNSEETTAALAPSNPSWRQTTLASFKSQ